MLLVRITGTLLVALLLANPPASGRPAPPAPVDYADPTSWLCRPDIAADASKLGAGNRHRAG
jgi:hypothetical protein